MATATFNPKFNYGASPELWADGNTRFMEYHRDCLSPRYVRVGTWKTQSWDVVHSDIPDWTFKKVDETMLRTFYKVRCRSCPACERARHNLWIIRAMAEWEAAQRTFFVTLTFGEQWFQNEWRKHKEREIERLNGKGHFDEALALTLDTAPEPHERDRSVELSFLNRALTAYLQRVEYWARKLWGAEMEYMSVTEFGSKTGRAHFHLLMHFAGSKPVNRRQLQRSILRGHWHYDAEVLGRRVIRPIGRATAREVADTHDAIYYTAKYVGKGRVERHRVHHPYNGCLSDPSFVGPPGPFQMTVRRYGGTRIRASLGYGCNRERQSGTDVSDRSSSVEGGRQQMTTKREAPSLHREAVRSEPLARIDVWPSGRTMGKAHLELGRVTILSNDMPPVPGGSTCRTMVSVPPGPVGSSRRTREEGPIIGSALSGRPDTRAGKPARRRERWRVASQGELHYEFPSWEDQIEAYKRRKSSSDG